MGPTGNATRRALCGLPANWRNLILPGLLGEYPDAVTETVPNSRLVIDDEEIFDAHHGGKLSVELKSPLDTQRALSIAYTPGVAQVSRAIAADHTLAARYTWANRLVAVISDGTAVLAWATSVRPPHCR